MSDQPYTSVMYEYRNIWMYLNVYITGDKHWV